MRMWERRWGPLLLIGGGTSVGFGAYRGALAGPVTGAVQGLVFFILVVLLSLVVERLPPAPPR